jgi:hypothetical protein
MQAKYIYFLNAIYEAALFVKAASVLQASIIQIPQISIYAK